MSNALVAALLAAAGWLVGTAGGRNWFRSVDGAKDKEAVRPSLALVLQMMSVAVRAGASIPHALDVIGGIVGGELGGRLCATAYALMQGYAWHDAWVEVPHEVDPSAGLRQWKKSGSGVGGGGLDKDDDGGASGGIGRDLDVLRDALEDSWLHGVSPIGRLESAVEQLDSRQRANIDQAASQLSVRLLMPTGLCFLPAFMLIGIVPTIAAFIT